MSPNVRKSKIIAVESVIQTHTLHKVLEVLSMSVSFLLFGKLRIEVLIARGILSLDPDDGERFLWPGVCPVHKPHGSTGEQGPLE